MKKQNYLRFLNNEMFRVFVNTILVIYIVYIVYRTPFKFLFYLDTPLVKILVLVLILALFCYAPDISLFIAIAYFVSIQALHARLRAIEGFTNGEKLTVVRIQDSGDILVKDGKGNLLEITKDVVPFCNLNDPQNILKPEETIEKPEQKPTEKKPVEEKKPAEKKPVESFEEKNATTTMELNQPEVEMITQLKEIDAIPRNLRVISRVNGDNKERQYNFEMENNGMTKKGVLIVKNDAMPELKFMENFQGSPIDDSTTFTPQGGCFGLPVKGGNLSNPCNAVITFKNELNAQGLDQKGPLGYDGTILGALAF